MSKIDLKSIILGDYAVGKTSLLMSYKNNGIIDDRYVPHITDLVEYNSEKVRMVFWDTAAGGEDYDRLRTLSYLQTDVFLLCFSLSEQHSYQNILKRWYPEITIYRPNTPIILVGTKLDLRDNEQHLNERTHFSSITTEEGMELSKDIGAVRYMECSSLQNKGITDVIEAAVEVGMQLKKQ